MAGERDLKEIRVALIGKTGCGKSALGNTLVGFRCFKSIPAGESVTTECKEGRGTLSSGQKVRVVDTPGILDTMKRDVRLEVTKSIGFLSPGPHAFIIVLSPNRATEEERRVIAELNALFGDKKFLDHTIIVMVRKNEIRDENGDEMDIHKFIDKQAADDVKTLYQECGRRIVAVENLASVREKQTYAKEVVDKISTLDGYYSHEYFKLLEERRLKIDQIAELEKALEEKANELNRSFCSIL
ncbi:GTPase IMAP family member 7-like [Mytilus californianus]|uniref:GTPase IMAP family member 7-like n=1 Tax=Mytilus californianus TaxID=6549 RepID=UPI0022473262|nr:GTPase IMAP family member 7-like [Mytilus californianus]